MTIPSLEYLCRSALMKQSILKMKKSGYRHYIVIGDYIDQYEEVLNMLKHISKVKLQKDKLFVKL
jgi:hypothetical protein